MFLVTIRASVVKLYKSLKLPIPEGAVVREWVSYADEIIENDDEAKRNIKKQHEILILQDKPSCKISEDNIKRE